MVFGSRAVVRPTYGSDWSVPPQTTRTLGLRWDLQPRCALKLQLEHVDTGGVFGPSFITPHAADGNLWGAVRRPVTVLGLGLDFVF